MTRKDLLKKLCGYLDEAMYLLETTAEKPDDNDEIWFTLNEAHSLVEDHLNAILIKEIKERQISG